MVVPAKILPVSKATLVRFVLLLVVSAVCACARVPAQKNEIINELIIRNNTNSELLDVALRVPDRNRLVSINLILPHTEYGLGFRNLENQREVAILTWIHRRRSYTRRIEAPIPESRDQESVYRVVITIHNDGLISSRLEPH